MKNSLSRILRVVASSALLLAGASTVVAQQGLPTDWSNSHVVFSQPQTLQRSVDAQRNPRYLHQMFRRGKLRGMRAQQRFENMANGMGRPANRKQKPLPGVSPQGDWSYSLGTAGAGLSSLVSPSKYSYDINGAPSCTADWVVYPVDQTASGTQASLVAFNNLYTFPAASATDYADVTANNVAAGQTVSVGPTTVTASGPTAAVMTLTVTGSANSDRVTIVTNGQTLDLTTGPIGTVTNNGCGTGQSGSTITGTFVRSGTRSTEATNIRTAITNCKASYPAVAPYTATVSNAVVTLTATTPGTTYSFASSTSSPNITNAKTPPTDGSNTGTSFAYYSGAARVSNAVLATNIQAALQRNANAFTASIAANQSNRIVVTYNAGSAGNNINASTTANTSLTWATPKLAGGADAQGMCPGGAPNTLWSYQTTPHGGKLVTSPIISLDGAKVAFIESSATGSYLHVITPTAGDGVDPTHPVAPSAMTDLQLSSVNVTNSSPYYDFAADTLYVGDDQGRVYKVTGVFNGTPAMAGGAWASGVLVNAGATMTSPIYDSTSQRVFVGDNTGRFSAINANGSMLPGLTGLGTITDGPIFDPTTNNLYVFSSNGIYETTTALAAPVTLSLAGAQHAGTFDDNFYTTGSGNMYACAGASPTLYSIPVTSGAMAQTFNPGPALAAGAAACSPLTEFKNGSHDWVFVGVSNFCGPNNTGCIQSFDVAAGMPGASSAEADSPGGTSGIIIDNASTQPQASSVYYSTGANATCGTGTITNSPAKCAVHRTQNGLQ